MHLSIRAKLVLSTLSFGFIIAFMFLFTWYTTASQKDDGFVINLGGRQRMLLQKMTKEAAAYHLSRSGGGGDSSIAEKARRSVEVFDQTLSAMRRSGPAPLSLARDAATRQVPKAEEPALGQLNKVDELWSGYRPRIEAVLSGSSSSADDLKWLIANSDAVVGEMDKAVGMLQADAEAGIRTLLIGQGFMFAIAIGIGALILLMARSIVQRLNAVNSFAGRLGSGDFTAVSGITGTDELARIGGALDSMAGRLRTMFGEIKERAVSLGSSSGSLSHISSTMARSTDEMSGLSTTVAAASEEMSSNMNSVAAAMEQASTNVSMVAAASEEMSSNVSEISRSTDETKTLSQNAVEDAKKVRSEVDALGEAAEEIGKVTEAITEISEQTKLLALNATIEAARAGEAGKGFAVVASEIKNLAQQTAQATQQIGDRIAGIQATSKNAVAAIQKISGDVANIDTHIYAVALAMGEQARTTSDIAKNVAEAARGIEEVNRTVAECSTVTREITRDIAMMDAGLKEMARQGRQVEENASTLNELGGDMSQAVSAFTI